MAETKKDKALPLFRIGAAEECWPWLGSVNPVTGYGHLRTAGTNISAHRLVYQLLVGPIPPGGQLDHVAERGCTSRACVNPAHLEVVTNRENQLRAPHVVEARTRTECPKGHDLTKPENVYYRPKGTKQCRECKRESVRKWRRDHRG